MDYRFRTVQEGGFWCILATMTPTRKHYSAAFKAQVVQELLKEEQTLNQVASRYGIHPNMLRRWKETVLQTMPDTLADEATFQKRVALLTAEHEQEKERLYAEIGKLTTQLNWLEKKAAAVGVQIKPDAARRAQRT